MQTIPYKINVQEMINKINACSERTKYKAVEHLLFNCKSGVVYIGNVLAIAEKVKLSTALINSKIASQATEKGLFKLGETISIMQKYNFTKAGSRFNQSFDRQLNIIYKQNFE